MEFLCFLSIEAFVQSLFSNRVREEVKCFSEEFDRLHEGDIILGRL